MKRIINEAQLRGFLRLVNNEYKDANSVTDEQLIDYIKEDISLHADYDKHNFEEYIFPDGRKFSASFEYDVSVADVKSQIVVCKDQ